ncbi:MAG: hypothetical protein D6784_17535 [Chloroflexi bacterium]|nr:MAG: hypothetical protein D6784_17535 [Chloroflexota bacterium]
MATTYQVEVYARGKVVAAHTVEAVDALSAINQVEALYGDPPQVEYTTVYHEDGTKETMLQVIGWHGYMFQARAVNRLNQA